jgi:HAD superfamily hydrolase (TIGR01490 family)
MIVALFDSDGTLFARQQGRGMMEYAEAHGRRRAARNYFVSLLPAYFLRKSGLMKAERYQQLIIRRLGWLVRGLDEAEGAALFEWVANDYLLRTKRPETAERLKEHRARGHRVAIVSGMFTPCLEWIGGHFGVTDLIGTGIEVTNGIYTGGIIPPVITGPVKAEYVRRHFSSRGLEVDWAGSHAYGDSFTDREMLGLVGHPVAVYPDARLHALAQERGWEVLGEPK